MGAVCAGVPVSVLAASPQRYVRARKRRHAHVPHPPQSLDCVRARPFRVPTLFASVRSARGRCGARWHVCVLASASVVAPPTLIRLSPRCAMHPPLRCAWLGRDTSLRQSPPSRRRLSHPGGGLRSGPAPPLRPLDTLVDAGFHSGASVPLAPAREPYERAAPWGHFASLVRSIAPQSARLPSESFAFFGASRATSGTGRAVTLPALQKCGAGGGAAARGGASGRRRGAADADGMDADATGGIPTERSAPSTADG